MNKKIIQIAVAAVFIAISSLSVYAGGPDGEKDHSEKWKERIEARKQEMFKELNLTDEQKQKIDDNSTKNRNDAKGLYSQMKELRNAMRQELEKDTLDLDKINQIQSQIKQTNEQIMDNRLQGILEVRGILTPEQFRKFSEKMNEHRERSMRMRWDNNDNDGMPSEGAPRDGSDG